MTTGANRLTSRATTPTSTAPGEATLPAVFVNSMLTALAKLGWNVDAVLEKAGLVAPDSGDPDARVSCRTWGCLIQQLRQTDQSRNLAIDVAALTPIGAYPLLDYLVLTSDNVGDALRRLAHYMDLMIRVTRMEVRDQEDPVRVVVTGGDTFGVEYSIALAVCHLREETEGRFVPLSIELAYQPADLSGMSRRLGCPVHPGGAWNGFVVSRETCALTLRRRDPVLREVLERQVLERPPDEDLPARVRRALSSRMTGKPLGITDVARDLALSARTLQRRLSESDVSFNQLLDDTRHNSAKELLADGRLSIGEVAFLLGYSEPAAFHRAFRRWTGTTPQAFRHRAAT